MTTKFLMTRDINGFNGFGLPFTDTGYAITLQSSMVATLAVPGNAGMGAFGISTSVQWIAIFSYDPATSVYVANNATVTFPTTSFVANVTQLNPSARLVKFGDVLSFSTSNTLANVTVSFYSIS